MRPPGNPRQRIAAVLLVVGAALLVERVIAFGGDAAQDALPALASEPIPAPPGAASTSRAASEPSALRLERLNGRGSAPAASPASAPGAAMFDAQSWQPPAPKAPLVRPAPPPPVAPPFPYAYIGGMSDGEVRTGFFVRNDRVLTLHAGDTVDANYRVDQLNDTQMTLTYLPLNQSLSIRLRVSQ